MPSGDNSFYVDQSDANNSYGEYIGEELVNETRKLFPLSTKKKIPSLVVYRWEVMVL